MSALVAPISALIHPGKNPDADSTALTARSTPLMSPTARSPEREPRRAARSLSGSRPARTRTTSVCPYAWDVASDDRVAVSTARRATVATVRTT